MMRMMMMEIQDERQGLAEVKEADHKMMMKKVLLGGGGEETDQESTAGGSSSEETESPKSVLVKGMRRRSTTFNSSKEKNTKCNGSNGTRSVHNQILRIRYEDSHVREEEICEALNLFSKDNNNHLASLLVFSKPILPSSPLGGGKTVIKTAD